MSDRPDSLRLRQGLVLLGGALVFALVVGNGADRFYLTPLGIGLIYLAAAVVGGRRGGYWATAVVLVGWGAAVVWAQKGRPDLDFAGLYLLGAGLGGTAGLLLAKRGFAVDALGVTATIAAAGAILAFAPQWSEVLEEGRTYALLVGLVGLFNVVVAVLPGRDQASEERRGGGSGG